MTITKRHIKIVSAVVLLTTFLTWFFYVHERLPKPIRAVTALIDTPVAIASGLSHYLKLGIDVYESPTAIVITNFITSVFVVIVVGKFSKWRPSKKVRS